MSAPVSVVMPHYNALHTVVRSIESVLAQSLPVSELIIVDDASSDFGRLEQLVARYREQLTLKLIRLEVNCGAAHARNIGIDNASCAFIAFLDSDDVWHPEKIAVQYDYMRGRSVNMTAHSYIFDLSQQQFPAVAALRVKDIGKHSFIWGNPLFTPTVMARRDHFIRFDRRFRRVDDYKCWYENLANGDHQLLNVPLAGGFKQAIGASGLTGSARLMHQSYLEVLCALRDERKMSLTLYLATRLCEAMKYPVRSMLIRFRKK